MDMRRLIQKIESATPIMVYTSENYDLIIIDSNKTAHYFYRVGGRMIYDGYSAPLKGVDTEGGPDG